MVFNYSQKLKSGVTVTYWVADFIEMNIKSNEIKAFCRGYLTQGEHDLGSDPVVQQALTFPMDFSDVDVQKSFGKILSKLQTEFDKFVKAPNPGSQNTSKGG